MRRVVLGAVALLAVAGVAQADLVTNGGFETSDFTGWTQFGNTGFTGVVSNAPHSGSYEAAFGPIGSTGGIYQSLAANAGDTICVDFWLRHDGGTPNYFDCSLDGVSIQSFTDAGSFGYTHFMGSVTVTNANPNLVFTFQQDPAWYYLDDVSADLCTVPLPTGSLLGVGGLAGVGLIGAIRRRRMTKA